MAPNNRPRERLKQYGASVLSDAELLAVVLKTGNKRENVVDMCNKLLAKHEIRKLSGCSLKELQAINGIGEAKAMQIMALFEFNKRCSLDKQNGKVIRSAQDVFDYCFPTMGHLDKEHFVVLHLDSKNKVLRSETISIGTLNASLIHPREVFKSAIKESSNTIILVHNHPSGDPEPSEEDKKITDILFKAGELVSIKVLDHVILGNNGWYGFKDG